MADLADPRLEPLIAILTAFGVSVRDLESSVLRTAARGDSGPLLRRLRRMEVLVENQLDDLADELADWIEDDFPLVVAAAGTLALAGFANEAWQWNSARLGALAERQEDLWDSAAVAMRYARDDMARFANDLRRVASQIEPPRYPTQQQALDRATRYMKSRGLATVTYRNGARYPMEAHLKMLFNTHTSLAQADISIREWGRMGVRFVELSDGIECGLWSHRAGPLANGMIVPIELYQAFPIAHPNCRRSAVARPDLVDAPGGPVAIPDNAERADVLLADATARLEAASSQLAAEARR